MNDFLTILGAMALLLMGLYLLCDALPAVVRDVRRWWRARRWEKD